jgi:type I restriction-modification system DNA methylase subunit
MPPKQSKQEQVKSLEATLWEAADRLRNRVESAEYKHVVLGLIFLKYVSDVFAKRRAALERLVIDPDSDYFMPTDDAKASVLEDRDEYASEGVFWVPEGTAGTTSARPPSRPTSVNASTRRWTRSRRRTRGCGECYRRGMHGAN